MIIEMTGRVNTDTTPDVTPSSLPPHNAAPVLSEVVQTTSSSDTAHEEEHDDGMYMIEIYRKSRLSQPS